MEPITTSAGTTARPDDAAGGSAPRPTGVRGRLLALLVGVALVVAGLGASIVTSIPVILAIPDFSSPSLLVWSLVATEVAFLAVGGAYVLWRLGRHAVPFRVPSRRDLGWLVGGYVAALVVAFGSGVVGQLLGVDTVTSVLEPFIVDDPTVLLVLAGLSLVLVGPAEELLFRGAIQTRLGRAFGPVLTVGLASLLFASIHVLNFAGGLTGVVYATATIFAVGVVLGTVYQRTENLAVPVLVHGLYNATLFGISYLALAGL